MKKIPSLLIGLVLISTVLLSACAESTSGQTPPITTPKTTTTPPRSMLTSTPPPTPGAYSSQSALEQAMNDNAQRYSAGIDSNLAGNPILGTPTDHSIAINVLTEKGMETFVEYGPKTGSYDSKTDVYISEQGESIVFEISQLAPNTKYFYRVNCRRENVSDFAKGTEFSFYTQRTPGSTFSFGVQGDSHPERAGIMFNSDLYQLTMQNVAKIQPDFYFTLGDDFSIEKLIGKNQASQASVDQVYLNQRRYLELVGASSPLFLVNGNHEQAAKYLLDGMPTNPAVLAASARVNYFPLPIPDDFYGGDSEKDDSVGYLRDYYSFQWGDALFVTIDPYWHSDIPVDNTAGADKSAGGKKERDLWGITLGDVQYQWFKQTLENSGAKYKFVFTHHVLGTGRGGIENAELYEWGGYNRQGVWEFDKMRPGWELPIHDLMAKNGVTIFFQGHDHLFARQELDGVIYQSVPNPADDTYTAFNRDAYIGDILPNSGFLNVTVSTEQVTVDYVRSYLPEDTTGQNSNGKVDFSYTVPSPSGSEENPNPTISLILGRPTQNSIALNLLSPNRTELSIAYGMEQGQLDQEENGIALEAAIPSGIELDRLEENTQYYYEIRTRGDGEKEWQLSQAGEFHTARTEGSPFVFAVQADPHLDEQSDPATYSQSLQNIVQDNPDFLIDLGDTFMTDKLPEKSEENILNRYLLMRDYYDSISYSIPLFLTLGNHEGEAGWDFNSSSKTLALPSFQNRLLYYPNPYPNDFYRGNAQKDNSQFLEDYYAFQWGDALFTILDPYRYTKEKPNSSGWEWTLGKEQYNWLKETLENSDAKYKFVFIHQLVGGDNQGRGGVEYAEYFEWGGNNLDGSYGFDLNRPDWGKPIHQLLVDNKVDIVFKGHDYFFAKQELDGIIYQTLPQPSHPGEKVNTAEEYGYLSGEIVGGSGYLRVAVSNTKTTVQFIKANDTQEVVSSYDIQ